MIQPKWFCYSSPNGLRHCPSNCLNLTAVPVSLRLELLSFYLSWPTPILPDATLFTPSGPHWMSLCQETKLILTLSPSSNHKQAYKSKQNLKKKKKQKNNYQNDLPVKSNSAIFNLTSSLFTYSSQCPWSGIQDSSESACLPMQGFFLTGGVPAGLSLCWASPLHLQELVLTGCSQPVYTLNT